MVVAGNPAVVVEKQFDCMTSFNAQRAWTLDVSVLMKRNGSSSWASWAPCPIAGVIWQHIHYIVGLQRLGHDVYYIEDSARLPYNPETFEVNNEFDYAARAPRPAGPRV